MIDADALSLARETDLRTTAERLGAKLKKVSTSEWAGNCPHCGGVDRFSINTKKNLWNCRGCGIGGDVIKLKMHLSGYSFPEAVEALIGKTSDGKRREPTPEETAAREAREAQRRREEAEERARNEYSVARILARLQPLIGTPGESYLRDVRCIDVSHWAIRRVLEDVDTLAWCEQVYLKQEGHELHGQRLGAIIGIFTDPLTGARTGGISRTYLDKNGRKLIGLDGKSLRAKSLGPTGVVRLSRDEDVLGGLHACEGIETGLSGMSDPRMNFVPMWAAGSSSTLAEFPVLPGVECFTILADNDENEASVNAASTAYWRWKDAGREVHIRQPKERGDLNDIIRRAK